ncbi:MAG TPA: hypothetical protein VGD56_14435 [Gemmatirosa sp.]
MLFLLLAAAPPDTVLARVVPLEPVWFVRLGDVLRLLLLIEGVALTGVLTFVAWKFRSAAETVRGAVERASGGIAPLTERATRVVTNVDHVVSTVRTEVERASALVARTETRIDDTLARAAARARELEALLDVAQREAEHSIVAAASTVAAVREGFAALRDELAGPAHTVHTARNEARDHRVERHADDDPGEAADGAAEHGPSASRPRPRIRTRER